ncbi:glycosyltransferase [Streptomyces sp. PSKA54]|uniref:Glycosyltransferase n=1 Tax=Streptomyces himalayensis subsp. aureolus TaxID=2758039 RepID=A0A7W2D8Z3_9ACTN|nr:glycosyltransferase [Streptomyces himalayensis]MBA4866945.1 glycosyltransferase [Streptomyces himalayensis subsp. aureolus]
MPTVLFAWRRTPPPFLIGGAEVTQQLLAEEFRAAGWSVLYLGTHQPPWDAAASELPMMRRHLALQGVPCEQQDDELHYQWKGITCHAVPQPAVEEALCHALDRVSPDLVITAQEGAADLCAMGRRTSRVVGILHSVSETGLGVLHGVPHHALAVSHFVATRARPHPDTGLIVLHPPFVKPVLKDDPRTGDLLMINPVAAKGSALLHRLIRRLPDRHFTLVEGWWDTAEEFAGYDNVSHVPRTYDMTPLYARHRLLLVPSAVEDAFPRVIIEAGLCGLPTLGARRGGIPEALGGSGMALPYDDTEAWTHAIQTADQAELGARARRRAKQLTRPCLPELAAAGVLDR